MKEDGRLIPERAIWQICHDISCGLFHIHSCGMVHYTTSSLRTKWGETICKIGDFELAGDVGSKDDGQGRVTLCTCRTSYSSWVVRNTLQFSLGLSLYELAASPVWNLSRDARNCTLCLERHSFLSHYVYGVEQFDLRREREMESVEEEARRSCKSYAFFNC